MRGRFERGLSPLGITVRAGLHTGEVERRGDDIGGIGVHVAARVLEYAVDPLVSSDIVGNPASCIFDSELTMVMPVDDASTMVKVQGWYDNEWGYANRLGELAAYIGR